MTEQDAMNYKVDRSEFGAGPWDSEPDRVDFVHAGLACLCLREHMGAWCGYVGVPLYHPALAVDVESLVDVHGGITYKDKCSPPICHVPQPDMPEEVMWYGFDCAHYMDLIPSRQTEPYVYRDLEYVKAQVKSLAEQLAGLGASK